MIFLTKSYLSQIFNSVAKQIGNKVKIGRELFDERANNQNPFLGRSNQFAPLDPAEFPPLGNQSIWRPW